MKRVLLYMVCAVLFSGCSPEDKTLPSSAVAIRFASDISVEVSKAAILSETTLPQDSRISLCASAKPDGDDNGQTVVMNNLPGTVGPEGAIDYNPVKYYETGKQYAFYACCPYNASLDYTDGSQTPSVSVNLATQAGAQDDYLWAALTGVASLSPAAVQKLTFRHALCRLRVRIWNGSGGEVSLGSITVKAPGSGVLSLADGSWSETGEGEAGGFSTFTLFNLPISVMLPQDAFYEVPSSLLLLPVGEDAMKSQTFSLEIGGKRYDINPTTPAGGWKGGVSYLYTVWYATDGITFKGMIEPWNIVDVGDAETEE